MALFFGHALPYMATNNDGNLYAELLPADQRVEAASGTQEIADGCLDSRVVDLRSQVEEQLNTNLLFNSSMAGATGSVLPTNWASGSVSGLTYTISSASTVQGFRSIEWTVSGTAATSGEIYLACEPMQSGSVVAQIPSEYVGSMYCAKVSGTIKSSMVLETLTQNFVDGAVQETKTKDLGAVTGTTFVRVEPNSVKTDIDLENRVNLRLYQPIANGEAVDFTIRVAAPQVEAGFVASPFISTVSGAVSEVRGRPSILVVPQLTKEGVVYPQLPVVSGADFTFTRATTATRVNASGLIESVASGVLRLDYPIGGGCPAALIEPAGTNLALQSEDFTTTWAATNISVSANSTGTLDPYGTNVADLLTATANGSARVIQTFSFVSGTTYTYSCFAKAGTGFFGMTMENGGVASGTAVIWNLTTGGFVVSGSAGSNYTLQAHNIENYGNGWYRCSMRVLMGASVAGNIRVNTSNGTMSTGIIQSDSGNTAYVFGAQMETGAIPTSYIPTTTGQATRNADVCSVSGVSGYIGQTEGTVYMEVDLRDGVRDTVGGNGILDIATSTTTRTNAVSILKGTTANILLMGVRTAGSNTILISTSYVVGLNKIALAYQSGNTVLYVNGVQALSSATAFTFSGELGAVNLGYYGSFILNDRIRAAAIYTTRLTDDQLANITRLT
jgi:hypothetical protein